MWDPPRLSIEPVPPALAGGFFTTSHQGSPVYLFLMETLIRKVFFLPNNKQMQNDTVTDLVSPAKEAPLLIASFNARKDIN